MVGPQSQTGFRRTCWAAPIRVEMSILGSAAFSAPPQTRSAVLLGTTTEGSRSALRSTSPTIPTTENASPPTKTAGAFSSVVMPSRRATPSPTTATGAAVRSANSS